MSPNAGLLDTPGDVNGARYEHNELSLSKVTVWFRATAQQQAPGLGCAKQGDI